VLAPSDEWRTYDHMIRNVVALLYGDDNTWTVSPAAISWFNARSVSKVFSELGIQTKSDCWDPRPVVELAFLSQHVKKFNGWWVPFPDRQKIYGTLRLGTTSRNVQWHLLRALAIRVDCWGDAELFRDVTLYCEHLRKLCALNPSDAVKGQIHIPWEQVIALWYPESAIRSLFLGEEQSGLKTVDVDILEEQADLV